MEHEVFIKAILSSCDSNLIVKCRERNDLEYKESFGGGSYWKYAKTMAAFANNRGGYILFGIKDKPRQIKGVNSAFFDFNQEVLTDFLNSSYSPEIIWETGEVKYNDKISIGFIYVHESINKPVVSLKNDTANKINSGDVFYRYRARSERIKYPEMRAIIEDRIKKEREQILKLIETIRKSDTTNLGIVNYNNGHFSTPDGADVTVDKKLIMQVLKRAKYIKSGSFDENGGRPVLKVTGNIDLAEEIPVPNMDIDKQYPFIQKELAKKLGIKINKLYALIWHFNMKGQRKFHYRSSPYKNLVTHKFSELAAEFLRDEIAKHESDPTWLDGIYDRYNKQQNDKRNRKK